MAVRDVTAVQVAGYPDLAAPARRTGVAVRVDLHRIARAISVGGLMALMVVGGIAVWTVIPLGGLRLASQLSDTYANAYLFAIVGIPAAMALCGIGLARVEQLYLRVSGKTSGAGVVPAWRRSISDSRPPARASVLEKVMVGSVLVAGTGLAVWFSFFARFFLPS